MVQQTIDEWKTFATQFKLTHGTQVEVTNKANALISAIKDSHVETQYHFKDPDTGANNFQVCHYDHKKLRYPPEAIDNAANITSWANKNKYWNFGRAFLGTLITTGCVIGIADFSKSMENSYKQLNEDKMKQS